MFAERGIIRKFRSSEPVSEDTVPESSEPEILDYNPDVAQRVLQRVEDPTSDTDLSRKVVDYIDTDLAAWRQYADPQGKQDADYFEQKIPEFVKAGFVEHVIQACGIASDHGVDISVVDRLNYVVKAAQTNLDLLRGDDPAFRNHKLVPRAEEQLLMFRSAEYLYSELNKANDSRDTAITLEEMSLNNGMSPEFVIGPHVVDIAAGDD